MNKLLQFNDEVSQALKNATPIVALESTIISHGMPYPDNKQTAIEVENIIRQQGATPATIILFNGKIHIGITEEILSFFSQSNDIMKASKRDIAYALTKKVPASTTVAATMYCAHLAGIDIFVTGGIGGVHHGAGENFDISADLTELAATPLTVVCAGAKSILDLPKTLEVLETQSIPVIGYKTDEFPAFYNHSSGMSIPHRFDEVEEISRFIQCHKQLQQDNGILVTNPIPKSAEIPDHEINPIIEQAQNECTHISGKSITPYLLKRITELTEGRSLLANIELIKNNAQLGAKLASNLIKFKKV